MIARALALALDAELRRGVPAGTHGVLVDAVDWLDPELNNGGRTPRGSVAPGEIDYHDEQHTAQRLRYEADHHAPDTRIGELWHIAADVIEGADR